MGKTGVSSYKFRGGDAWVKFFERSQVGSFIVESEVDIPQVLVRCFFGGELLFDIFAVERERLEEPFNKSFVLSPFSLLSWSSSTSAYSSSNCIVAPGVVEFRGRSIANLNASPPLSMETQFRPVSRQAMEVVSAPPNGSRQDPSFGMKTSMIH